MFIFFLLNFLSKNIILHRTLGWINNKSYSLNAHKNNKSNRLHIKIPFCISTLCGWCFFFSEFLLILDFIFVTIFTFHSSAFFSWKESSQLLIYSDHKKNKIDKNSDRITNDVHFFSLIPFKYTEKKRKKLDNTKIFNDSPSWCVRMGMVRTQPQTHRKYKTTQLHDETAIDSRTNRNPIRVCFIAAFQSNTMRATDSHIFYTRIVQCKSLCMQLYTCLRIFLWDTFCLFYHWNTRRFDGNLWFPYC